MERMIEFIEKHWNPTGEALAAEFWQNKEGKVGFSPVCLNKFKSKEICQLGQIERSCWDCTSEQHSTVTSELLNKHFKGKIRLGIYPMLSVDKCH
jgi:hypothetical protein